MKLVYQVEDKPGFGKTVVFALQQLLAIMAATLVAPLVVNGNVAAGGGANPGLSSAAALFGAGVGTLIYLLFTRFKSPVFLGSSFAFINSMVAAFTGAVSVELGYLGIIIGATMAGLVYVILSMLVKFLGVDWINKLMPKVVIGPTVAIIGLSLAGNAIGNVQSGGVAGITGNGHTLLCILCGVITLVTVVLCSTYGKKMTRLIPFIIGILVGYAVALIFTIIGNAADVDAMKIISFDSFKALVDGGVKFTTFFDLPNFTFIKAFGGFKDFSGAYLGTIAAAYIPVALVVFAEHIADHENISSIIDRDLLKEPGLDKTLLGDGVGSIAGAFFGGCPNTTYGESVACVAISGNASVITLVYTAVGAILVSFISPFVAFVNSIPPCVMGGVCITLYGFIAVSGLKMIQKVDLGLNKNLFVVSTILVCGIGGLALNFGKITITSVATALILGIIVNNILKNESNHSEENNITDEDVATAQAEIADKTEDK